MIAIDMDGTLLSPTGEVTPRTKAAVHSALSAGLLVCFATGRNFTESKTVIDAVGHYATAVFAGGATIIDTKGEIVLHRTLMEPALARAICAAIEGAGQVALALQDTAAAGGLDYLISDGLPINPATAHWMKATAAKFELVEDLGSRSHEHTIRLGIVADGKVVNKIRDGLVATFADRIFTHSIHAPNFGVDVLEIFDPSVNKWQGILNVAGRHGIAPAEIIAIGDDYNDIHMIRGAGLGVAMGNARDEIRAMAGLVIGTNKEEGLATFLEEIVESHAVEPAPSAEGVIVAKPGSPGEAA